MVSRGKNGHAVRSAAPRVNASVRFARPPEHISRWQITRGPQHPRFRSFRPCPLPPRRYPRQFLNPPYPQRRCCDARSATRSSAPLFTKCATPATIASGLANRRVYPRWMESPHASRRPRYCCCSRCSAFFSISGSCSTADRATTTSDRPANSARGSRRSRTRRARRRLWLCAGLLPRVPRTLFRSPKYHANCRR